MRKFEALALLVVALTSSATCRQLQTDQKDGMSVVLSDGVAIPQTEENNTREAWCQANLPSYTEMQQLPAGYKSARGPSAHLMASAPSRYSAGFGPAAAPRSAPKPLMATAPGHHARYVCSDAFFYCFARDKMSAEEAGACSSQCCHGVCTEDFVYDSTHGWCSTRAGVHACCDLCTEQATSG